MRIIAILTGTMTRIHTHVLSHTHTHTHSHPPPRIPPHPPLLLVQWLMANKRTSTVLEEEERAKAQRDLKALIEQTLGDVGYEAESL